jgi:signal recognition particle receptor subunit beta
VDGVIFVADSQIERMESNMESLDDLKINLAEQGYDLDKLAFAVQYNKRDLPNVVPVADMDRLLNYRNVVWFEAVAVTGKGVFETLKAVAKQVLFELKKHY